MEARGQSLEEFVKASNFHNTAHITAGRYAPEVVDYMTGVLSEKVVNTKKCLKRKNSKKVFSSSR